jgi:asparagine synthase (glutamine-hydrolysing)
MCGILGGNLIKSNDEMKKGLISMMHRGTDGNTIFSFKNGMKLSHNRLSIQDLSETANQPMVSDDGRYYLAFNGELWKSTFEKFDKELRSKYNFKTKNSDSELLLYFLIDNCENLKSKMNELEGMFSFAFYDKEKDYLTLGRDFMGRLPFYYYHNGQEIVFSSEIKGITESIPEIQYYNIDKGSRFNSSFKDKEVIKIVEPGTFITYNSVGVLKEYRWFNFKPTPYDNNLSTNYYPRTENEFLDFEGEDKGVDYYASEFKKLLWEAVEDELVADVPICTILSGGIDSTIITYILSKINPNIEAFVVNVWPKKRTNKEVKDDLYYARLAAKEFGIKLHEINVDRKNIEDILAESVWASETHKWTQVSPAVAQLFLAWKIRRKGYKVVFGGEGADEIFASYGDVFRFCWPVPLHYHQKRVNLINNLHKTNLIRTNKAMMYGGEIELRTPFLNKKLIDFGLRIPTKYRDENGGNGKIMKYILRKAFDEDIKNKELLWRPKKTFQVGCHTDFLKEPIWKAKIEDEFEKLFIKKDVPTSFIKRQIGHIRGSITEVTID